MITEKKGDSIIKHDSLKKQLSLSAAPGWKRLLASAIRDPHELLEMLDLLSEPNKHRVYFPDTFKLLVPVSYVKRMKKGDWNDPLLKQVLPTLDENKKVAGFVSDPVGDLNATVSAGLLHKYQGRVLLVATGACPVHCRYCFRQHFPYADNLIEKSYWQKTLSQIERDSSIHEVILSGGDPLILSDDRLQKMCSDIARVAHVKTIRFHSRVPVFLPERIDSLFLSWVADLPVKKVMVVHANHANEIDQTVGQAFHDLTMAGFVLLNQSVLLKGVNDDMTTLKGLSIRLFDFGVLPYYLHQLDRVEGAAHFEVSKSRAIKLMDSLKDALPGYLVPKYVEEISGKRSKQGIV